MPHEITTGDIHALFMVMAQKRFFENRALRWFLGPKRDPVTGRLRMRSNGEI